MYSNGTSHSDFHNASYVPYFLDEMDNQTLRAEAVRKCGGDASRVQCIFDYIFADERLAEQTLKNDKDQQAALHEIGMCFSLSNIIISCIISSNHSKALISISWRNHFND